MVAAMEVVKGGCSIKRAAEDHNVPRTTLQDRILGRVKHGSKPGPAPYLNQVEEGDLMDFLEVVSSIGYGKTRKQVKAVVEKTARDKGVLQKERIGDGWFRRFLERRPHLALRKGDWTAFVWMDAMNDKQALDNYFILLKNILTEHDLLDRPGQIYNVDESGIPLDHRSPHILTKRGKKSSLCYIWKQIAGYSCGLHKCNWAGIATIHYF